MGYIRLLLALIVASAHLQTPGLYNMPDDASIFFVGPIVAVKIFFIISGFYMAMAIGNYHTTRAFFISRAIRLYPIYWMTIAICLIACVIFRSTLILPFISLRFWTDIGSPLGILIFTFFNASFIGLDLGLFTCAGADNIFGLALAHNTVCGSNQNLLISHSLIAPAWTLSLEVYFYLLVPFFALARNRTVVIIAAISFSIALFIAFTHNLNPWFRSFFPAELYLFLIGFISYRLRDYFPFKIAMSCSVACLVAIVLYRFIPELDWKNANGGNIVLYFLFAAALPALFKIGEKLPLERKIGDLSYPVYICHTTILSILQQLGLHRVTPMPLWLVLNLLTIVLVSMALLKVTSPIEHLRSRFRLRSTESRREKEVKMALPSVEQILT